MGATTGIAWADATVNFWIGCTKVSAACDHCYAEAWAARFGVAEWGHGKARRPRLDKAAAEAFRLQRKAQREGRRLKVFANSLSDLFDAEVPEDWRDFAFAVFALTPALDWQILTKRPKWARAYLGRHFGGGESFHLSEVLFEMFHPFDEWHHEAAANCLDSNTPLQNVWLGTTVETQAMADLRVPELLAAPAALRWLSIEPLLGEINLRKIAARRAPAIDALTGRMIAGNHSGDRRRERLDWVVVGGESGRGARPMHPDWVRSLRDQCLAAEVPFFFKQWGEYLLGERTPESAGGDGHGLPLRFADGDIFEVLCDGTDIVLAAAEDEAAGPRKIWREFHGWQGQLLRKLGTKRAGHLLDGRAWQDFPQSPATLPTAKESAP
mgnify:FL=1